MSLSGIFGTDARAPESGYAWMRLAVIFIVATIGGVGMWSMPVALKTVQDDFGVARAAASVPYTLNMLGFAVFGIVFGRMVDRFGITIPVLLGTLALSAGYLLAGVSPNLWFYSIVHGVLIGGGMAAFFGPLMTDASQWFVRHRGIAVGIVGAGNYAAGMVWSKPLEHFIATVGWRTTYFGVAAVCLLTLLPLCLMMRRRPVASSDAGALRPPTFSPRDLGITPRTLQILLCIAAVGCCVAMATPQIHIVAYCGDLGYGVARGAEMLAVMLAFGIISRVACGFIADRIGGVGTVLLGSSLQGVTLILYSLYDGLISLYLISALFGLVQGMIVPSYAIIVSEYFDPKEAGVRLGVVLMATLTGMAFGGWLAGAIFDFTGSYGAAFLAGLAFAMMNCAIAIWLLLRPNRGGPRLAPA